MTTTIIIAIITANSAFNLAIVGLLLSLNYKLGLMNGKVRRHDEQLKACPLCPDLSPGRGK